MLGDITAGTTVQYTVTGVVWQSSPMAPGSYILEAAYAGTGAQRRVEIPLTEKATAYATLDLTGPTYSVSGVASLMGNVQFSSSSYAVSVSSIAGLLNTAQTTSYCLLGSASPMNISAVHGAPPHRRQDRRYLNGHTGSTARRLLPPGGPRLFARL